MIETGVTWNESETYADPVTGRKVRRLTSTGRVNQTSTYHTNAEFTSDGRYLVFVSARDEYLGDPR